MSIACAENKMSWYDGMILVEDETKLLDMFMQAMLMVLHSRQGVPMRGEISECSRSVTGEEAS